MTTEEKQEEQKQEQPSNAFDAYEAGKAERADKTNGFICKAQDGKNILVRHQIVVNVLELVNTDGMDLKFPSTEAFQKNNYAAIEELTSSLENEIASFANELGEKENLIVTDFSYGGSHIIAPSPLQEATPVDSSN